MYVVSVSKVKAEPAKGGDGYRCSFARDPGNVESLWLLEIRKASCSLEGEPIGKHKIFLAAARWRWLLD